MYRLQQDCQQFHRPTADEHSYNDNLFTEQDARSTQKALTVKCLKSESETTFPGSFHSKNSLYNAVRQSGYPCFLAFASCLSILRRLFVTRQIQRADSEDICDRHFLRKETQDISLLRTLQLSNISAVLLPKLAV